MEHNRLRALTQCGQSVWYDHIHRDMLRSGQLARMVDEDDLRGVTSNPTIFDKAISGGDAYDRALAELAHTHPDYSSRDFFYALASEDIRAAADVLRTVFEATDGRDGWVSLEVSPHLANDTAASVEEARRLFARVDRPNVLIKIPATPAGLPAIEQLIAEGINVNVTLLFSVRRYVEVAQAYLRGLRRRRERQQPLGVSSVASFFVSRVDTLLDRRLEQQAAALDLAQRERMLALRGKLAVANAKVAYRKFGELFETEEFAQLRRAGARPQRMLWASTSTKNPQYRDVLYVEELIGPETINTLPPATYQAFKDHGVAAPTLIRDVAAAAAQLEEARRLGIDWDGAMQQLEEEGVDVFAKSFDNLLKHIEEKVSRIRSAA